MEGCMDLNDLANICTVLSLFVSSYAVYRVIKIDQKLNQNGNNNKASSQNIKGSGNKQVNKQ